MSGQSIHFVWLMHQPFFIPDDEIAWRVDSTYTPLLDSLFERNITASIGITGSLLVRCANIRPEFVDLLRRACNEKRIQIMGTGNYHPFLPYLSTASADTQIRIDRDIKKSLGLILSNVFWPNELAWSMRIGAMAIRAGYNSVLIDSLCSDQANAVPMWVANESGLSATQISNDDSVGISSKIATKVYADGKDCELELLVRDHGLAQKFVELMTGENEDAQHHLDDFLAQSEKSRLRSTTPNAPIILAEDAERILPVGIGRFLDLLDGLVDLGVVFIPPEEMIRLRPDTHYRHVPAGTMEGEDTLWTKSTDDRWFRDALERVSLGIASRFSLSNPVTADERMIRDLLLQTQDSGFYFWRFIARTRTPFYKNLQIMEEWLAATPIVKTEYPMQLDDGTEGEAPILNDARIGFLMAFRTSNFTSMSWREKHGSHFLWSDDTSGKGSDLDEFDITQEFLLGKQMVLSEGEEALHIIPDMRGLSKERIEVRFSLSQRNVDVSFNLIVSLHGEQNIITALLYCELPDISLDELIFIKQAKWYQADDNDFFIHLIEPKNRECRTFREMVSTALETYGLSNENYDPREWPIFDFIEVRDVGPAVEVGSRVNVENPLTSRQHLGLVTGDEGYRLLDPGSKWVGDFVNDKSMHFVGRKYFLYHFQPTSCICFFDREAPQIRAEWADRYSTQVGKIRSLDRYQRFENSIPCLSDGMVVLVEACLLRYTVLSKIDRHLKILQSETHKDYVRRIRKRERSELADIVDTIQRISLYADSSLWIIGGDFTDRLFAYDDLMERIEGVLINAETLRAESRSIYESATTRGLATKFSLALVLIALVTILVSISNFGIFDYQNGDSTQEQMTTGIGEEPDPFEVKKRDSVPNGEERLDSANSKSGTNTVRDAESGFDAQTQ